MKPSYGELVFSFERAVVAAHGLTPRHKRHEPRPNDSVGSVGCVLTFCPCGKMHLIGAGTTGSNEMLTLRPSPELYCIEQYESVFTVPAEPATRIDPDTGMGDAELSGNRRLNQLAYASLAGYFEYSRRLPWSAAGIRHLMCGITVTQDALSGSVFRVGTVQGGGMLVSDLRRRTAYYADWLYSDGRRDSIRVSPRFILVANAHWTRHLVYR